MNTLIYGSPNHDLIESIKNIDDIKVKFVIGNSANYKCNIDISDLIKFNFGTEYKAIISQEAQKFYEKFYNDNFNIFVFQFVRRGIKILDVHEIRNYFAHYYYNFFNIVKEKKLDLIIFFSIPHCGVDFILYEITKLLNIKTIMFYQTIFPNKYFTIKKIDELGENLKDLKIKKNLLTENDIRNFVNNYQKKSNIDLKIHKKKSNRVKFNKNFFRELILRILINMRLIQRENAYTLDKKYFQNIKKIEVSLSEINKLKKDKKIVFFPLHFQPELTTSILGGLYEDQLAALEKLNVFIKNNWIIIVKDHPFQTSYQRNDFFFKRFCNLNNFYFVNNETDSRSLIEMADLVVTITGTAGFEALLDSKKTIVFGKAWYGKLHGVLHIINNTSNEQIYNFIDMEFDKLKFMDDLVSLISTCDNGVVEYDYKELVDNFDHNLNCKQVAENIKKFLKENFI